MIIKRLIIVQLTSLTLHELIHFLFYIHVDNWFIPLDKQFSYFSTNFALVTFRAKRDRDSLHHVSFQLRKKHSHSGENLFTQMNTSDPPENRFHLAEKVTKVHINRETSYMGHFRSHQCQYLNKCKLDKGSSS